MKILVTKKTGFIGSDFVHYVLQHRTNLEVINLDLLTYTRNLQNVEEVTQNTRYQFVKRDIANCDDVRAVFQKNKINAVINFAAKTHVNRSIDDSSPFVHTNVIS